MDIFKKRVSLKPYEYPELITYSESIRHSYWIHSEFNYTSDIQDFATRISKEEKGILKRAMLAIAQIEVNVKTFWGDIYQKMPKPEIGSVGFTFAESEVRHMDAYSHLLEILGLNQDFDTVIHEPVIAERIKYLNEIVALGKSSDPAEYAKAIMMFSLFIENVSLFSQFLIIMAFNKFENTFKGMSNAVEATSKEEQLHALFGAEIVNIIRRENPEWFDEKFIASVQDMAARSLESEIKVIDWIYGDGTLKFLPKEVVIEFVKNRFNKSMQMVGLEKPFDIDNSLVSKSDWFDTEVLTTKHTDFFYKRSINYNKRSQSISGNDLF